MTLLEVTLASVILGAVILIAMDGLLQAQRTLAWTNHAAELEKRANIQLARIVTDLQSAANLYVSSTGDTLAFQIPIDYPRAPAGIDFDGDGVNDPDGDFTDAAGNTEFGFHAWDAPTSGDDPLGWSVVYQFTPIGQTLNETVDRVDYNGDNRLDDIFIVGRVDAAVLDAAGTDDFRALPAPPADAFEIGGAIPSAATLPGVEGVLMRADGALDIDEDGANDPIFMQVDVNGLPSPTGSRVVVTLWLAGRDGEGRAKTKMVTTTIHLRNL